MGVCCLAGEHVFGTDIQTNGIYTLCLMWRYLQLAQSLAHCRIDFLETLIHRTDDPSNVLGAFHFVNVMWRDMTRCDVCEEMRGKLLPWFTLLNKYLFRGKCVDTLSQTFLHRARSSSRRFSYARYSRTQITSADAHCHYNNRLQNVGKMSTRNRER